MPLSTPVFRGKTRITDQTVPWATARATVPATAQDRVGQMDLAVLADHSPDFDRDLIGIPRS